MIRLLIKTHNKTGLKYLCKTEQKNWKTYPGSGDRWLAHLREHGFDFRTELLLETEDRSEFYRVATDYSIEFDVVRSDDWANARIENGDGGDTVSSKTWITDGLNEKYIERGSTIPDGWTLGRSIHCTFKDPNRQKELSSRSDREKAGRSIKRAWAEGRFKRDHSKCGVKGADNPAKRIEVREKISNSYKNKTATRCSVCDKMFKNLGVHRSRSNGCH